jgi:hypothetical protein
MRTLLLLAVLAGGLAAASQPPDPKDIVRRSVQAIEADWSRAPGYSFEERDVESKHNGPFTVKTYQVLMIEGSPYKRLIAIGDRPLSATEQALEEQKLRAEIDKRQHESDRERRRRIAKYEKERARDQAMLLNMMEAFDFEPAGEETVNGHDCWVMDAQPKNGYRPKDRESKVLTGMRGRLWIDKSQNQWVRVKAEVFTPVSFFGFVAKIGPGTRIDLEQQPVADNLWLPKSFILRVKASAFGIVDESSTDDETYRQYKPMPKTSAELVKQ